MRTVVITGGTSGIGLETAKYLTKENYNIAVIGRKESKIQYAVEIIGNKSRGYHCDVSTINEIEITLKRIFDDFGSIDVLVNNAGILDTSTIDSLSEEEWNQVININLKGTFFMIQKAIPYLA